MTRNAARLIAAFLIVGCYAAPTGAWLVACQLDDTALRDALECTCAGGAHDPLCPLHRHLASMDSVVDADNGETCHMRGSSQTGLPLLALVGDLPLPAFRPPRPPREGSMFVVTQKGGTRSVPVDTPPPRS